MKHPRATVFAGAIISLSLMHIMASFFGYATTVIPRGTVSSQRIDKKPAFSPKVGSVSNPIGCGSVQVGFQADPNPHGPKLDRIRITPICPSFSFS